MARLIDTNLLVRYFTEDDPKKAKAVAKLLKNTKEIFLLPDIVFAEIEWTLRSFYKTPKATILTHLGSLLALQNMELNTTLMAKTLLIWKEYNIDFIDAYLTAYAKEKHTTEIYSYDESLDKVKGLTRLAP